MKDVERLVDQQGRVSYRYTGEDATVVVNEQGKVVTVGQTTRQAPEDKVDNEFRFLGESERDLANSILKRRNKELSIRIGAADSISRSDAAEVISTLSDEISDNLDADWEPTDYGQRVSHVLALVNARRIAEWPE